MSYKKIVAGVATVAVASALIVPAAFAAPADDAKTFEELAKVEGIDAAAKAQLEAVVKAAKDVVAAEKKVVAAKAEVAAKKAALEAATETEKADAETNLKKAESDLKTAEENVETLTKALETAKATADKAVQAAKLQEAYAPKVKAANEKVEAAVAAAKAALIKIDLVKLTSLEKTYKDQVRTLIDKKAKINTILKKLNKYKDQKVNTKLAHAEELDATVKAALDALGQIKDADVKAATKKGEKAADKKAAKATKKGLPKTADQTPVAPLAAAGAAALIAAGLVASRKVNA